MKMSLVKLVKANEIDPKSPTPDSEMIGFIDGDYV